MPPSPERWLPVRGFEGKYSISNLGRVRSEHRSAWNGRVWYKIPIRFLLSRPDADGYLLVDLYSSGVAKTCKVHRLVADAFIPNPGNLPMVNHCSGEKTNNSPPNLEWVTSKQNCRHAVEVLGRNFGDGCGASKLSDNQVIKIRRLSVLGKTDQQLATLYSVSRPQISRIRNYKSRIKYAQPNS